MRYLPSLVLWAAFATIVAVVAFGLLQACGLSHPGGLPAGWNFCPVEPDGLSAEAERHDRLLAEAARLQRALADKARDCAAIPPPKPPPLNLPTEAGRGRPQQTAARRPPPPPPPPPPTPVRPPDALPCNWSGESGGEGITRNRHYLGNKPGMVTVTYDMKQQPDTLHVIYHGRRLASTYGPVSYGGHVSFFWNPEDGDYTVEIVVIGHEAQTQWSYAVSCPG